MADGRTPVVVVVAAEPLEDRRLFAVGAVSEQIIVDQFGWRADAQRKVVVFADPVAGQNAAVSYTPGGTFQVRRAADDGVAFSGPVTAWKNGQTDTSSGDRVWHGDFSSFAAPGEYYVYDPARNLRSYNFRIDNAAFNGVLRASARTFYYQRAGTAIDAAHGGNWTHGVSHMGPGQDTQARLWNNGGPVAGTQRDLRGGWYDAGDYNKYVPYTTGVLWNLLSAYEWNAPAFPDDWNIPESGNGVPDLLDEVKYELDWLLRMQNPNGSVLSRLANATYDSGNFDPATDTQPRFYTQATTWATASFAASTAHAARVFEAFGGQYPGYAAALRGAAEDAWAYLQATPNMTPSNGQDGGGTGGSGNGGLAASPASADADEDRRLRVLAAAELFKTTGTAAYKTYFESNYKNPNTADNGFHPLLDGVPRFDASLTTELNHAYVTYATSPGASTSIVNEIKNALRNNLDPAGFMQVAEYDRATDPYRAFMFDGHYSWGSNRTKAEWGNVLIYAIRLGVGTDAERAKAREIAEEYLHYFHGRNPLSWVYLSNMGTKGANLGGDKSPMEIYHSWFGDGSSLYDGPNSTYGPAPGFVVGGPNRFYPSDPGDPNLDPQSPPMGEPTQKAYRDWNTSYPQNSWEITEPAIYYQAAYTLLLSQFATAPAGTPTATVVDRHVFYNNSGYDAGDTAAGDDGAVDPAKSPLPPGGGTPGPANVTSYSRGINGVMVDVLNLPDGTVTGNLLGPEDVAVRVGPPAGSGAPAAWSVGPTPSVVNVRPAPGGGGHRVSLVWPDGAIVNRWVEVTLLANADTGLAAPDVFRLGNLVGDADGSRSVNLADFGALRAAFGGANLSVVAGRSDFNRDRSVNLADFGLLRGNFGKSLPAPPATAATAAASVAPRAAPGSASEAEVLNREDKAGSSRSWRALAPDADTGPFDDRSGGGSMAAGDGDGEIPSPRRRHAARGATGIVSGPGGVGSR